jgi:hypothetical protein
LARANFVVIQWLGFATLTLSCDTANETRALPGIIRFNVKHRMKHETITGAKPRAAVARVA